MSIVDIPNETFTDYILPHITVKEVGALAMMCKDFKELFDDNDIWKVLYLRTVDWKITDRSIHIGAHQGEACDPEVTWNFYGYGIWTKDITCFTPMCCCCPKVGSINFNYHLRRNTVALVEARHNAGQVPSKVIYDHRYSKHNQPQSVIDTRNACKDAYFEVWETYNREKGLSTVNLCQNPNHYKVETLDIPGCRNFKSFKTMTLKKILTQETKPVATLDRKLRRQEKKIAKHQAYLDKLKDTYEKDCETSARMHSLKDKVGNALAALKPKPKPKKTKKDTVDRVD